MTNQDPPDMTQGIWFVLLKRERREIEKEKRENFTIQTSLLKIPKHITGPNVIKFPCIVTKHYLHWFPDVIRFVCCVKPRLKGLLVMWNRLTLLTTMESSKPYSSSPTPHTTYLWTGTMTPPRNPATHTSVAVLLMRTVNKYLFIYIFESIHPFPVIKCHSDLLTTS